MVTKSATSKSDFIQQRRSKNLDFSGGLMINDSRIMWWLQVSQVFCCAYQHIILIGHQRSCKPLGKTHPQKTVAENHLVWMFFLEKLCPDVSCTFKSSNSERICLGDSNIHPAVERWPPAKWEIIKGLPTPTTTPQTLRGCWPAMIAGVSVGAAWLNPCFPFLFPLHHHRP